MSDQRITLPDVDDDTNDQLNGLLGRLERLAPRNRMLEAYYEAEKALRKIHGGIVPEQYYRLGLILGWSAKAVDTLALRCNLERMVWADGTLDDFGYREVWDQNRLGSEVDQAIIEALILGPAFAVASQGDESAGEPAGMVHFYSAADATGERNPRTRMLDSLLVVRDRDKSRQVTALSLLVNNETIAAQKVDGTWQVVKSEHTFGVPAAVMPYRPRLKKPMGRTRLTRPVRALQDAAARTLVRLEGHMDVYANPEFWVLGAGLDIFRDENGVPLTDNQRRLGRIKGIPDDMDREGEPLARADVKKFEASSPEPQLKALNAYSKLFAREASLPDSSVAISDIANPTSAESYDASQYELISEAEGATDEFTPALRRVVPIAMAMQNNLQEVPEAWRSIDAKWRDPRYISRAAQADAGSKQVASVPWLAETEVGLELIGLDDQQIQRAQAERRRAQANVRMDALIGAAPGPEAEEARVLKAKADAMGVLIRAGVDPEDAAAQAGLSGVTFTGAVPVSLRPVASDAARLEDR